MKGWAIFAGGMLYYGGVGRFSTLISRMSWLERNFDNRKSAIDTFMYVKKFPEDIQVRVKKYHEYVWVRQEGMEEEEILRHLPPVLEKKILGSLNADIVSRIDLFAGLNKDVLQEITAGLEIHIFVPEDTIVYCNQFSVPLVILNAGWAEIYDQNGAPRGKINILNVLFVKHINSNSDKNVSNNILLNITKTLTLVYTKVCTENKK